MPNLKISADDEGKVRAAAFFLKKQQDTSLSLVMKVVAQFELKKFDDRIRRLAEDRLLEESPGRAPELSAPPPSSIASPIDQESIDDYTKMGKAKKVSEAISQAAKHAGVEDGNVTPSKVRDSMNAPEQMVKAAGSWKKVKELYMDEEGTMRLILQYRIDEVGRIYKQVIDQMWKDNEPKRNAYSKDKSVPKEEVFQLNDLQFAMMGSTDLTSDYDVSFDHNVEKPWVGTTAVKLFNQKFRAKWGKEAGTVFDTNVYTQGFMPSDMSNIPAGLEKSITGRLGKVTEAMRTDKSEELAALKFRLEQQAKTAARVREQMAKDSIDNRSKTRITDRVSRQKVFEIEDLMSLVKIRKFMTNAEWGDYSKLLLEGLPEGGPAGEAAASVLEQADKTFVTLNEQLRTRMAQLRESGSGADEADLELEASNRLYEEYLEQAGAIVATSKGILQGPAISDWTQKQSSALYFANEAYHTSGPVESTVIGQQMGIAMKQVAEQHLQAINEQTGFVVEQHEHAHGNNGRFLWKSAKYVDRICSILGQINKDIGPTALKDPKNANTLKPLSSQLLTIKKGIHKDPTKDQMSLTALESAGGGDVLQMVVELNADVNQQLRIANAVRSDALAPGQAAEEPSEPEEREMAEEDALDQRIVEGLNPELQKEVQARVGTFELDRSYNDNPEELREKAAAVEEITRSLTVGIRNGLPYGEALRDVDDKLGKLAMEMDKKYIRPSAARELRVHAQTLAPEGGWESAYEMAVNLMREGATLQKAKAGLGAMLQVRSG